LIVFSLAILSNSSCSPRSLNIQSCIFASTAHITERLELYLYSHSMPSRQVTGWTSPSNPVNHFSSHPYTSYASPLSCSWILSSYYFMKSANYKTHG
jgi:hypothetical protein